MLSPQENEEMSGEGSSNLRELNISVTPAPPHNPSRMPTEHRLFLRALQGLRDGEAMRLYCDDREEASLLAEVTRNFLYRERRKGHLNHDLSVIKREERGSLVIYVLKSNGGGQKGK